MPEITGNAAYLVNPYDQHQIAEGILKLSTDESLRDNLTQMGFERSKIFSWENTARIILDGFPG